MTPSPYQVNAASSESVEVVVARLTLGCSTCVS